MSQEELAPQKPERDDFDRMEDQGIWTTQASREGGYPKPGDTPVPPSSITRPPRRVYGSDQLLIADNDRTVQETHARSQEESELRAGMSDEERTIGAEQAKAILRKLNETRPEDN